MGTMRLETTPQAQKLFAIAELHRYQVIFDTVKRKNIPFPYIIITRCHSRSLRIFVVVECSKDSWAVVSLVGNFNELERNEWYLYRYVLHEKVYICIYIIYEKYILILLDHVIFVKLEADLRNWLKLPFGAFA
jgi:hypothetical protein